MGNKLPKYSELLMWGGIMTGAGGFVSFLLISDILTNPYALEEWGRLFTPVFLVMSLATLTIGIIFLILGLVRYRTETKL